MGEEEKKEGGEIITEIKMKEGGKERNWEHSEEAGFSLVFHGFFFFRTEAD